MSTCPKETKKWKGTRFQCTRPSPQGREEKLSLATKMADNTERARVIFSGSSQDDIENAKAFWKAIDPPLKPKTALVVSGVDQRLPTAPKPQNSKY